MAAPRRTTITRQRKAACDRLCKLEFGIPAETYNYIQELDDIDLVEAVTEFGQSIVISFKGNDTITYADDLSYLVEEV